MQGNSQDAASFSPIRSNTVCLMAICLFQLAVLGGRTPSPHHSNYISLVTPSPSPSVRPALPLIFHRSVLPLLGSSSVFSSLIVHPTLCFCPFSSSTPPTPPPLHPPSFSNQQIKDKANEGGSLIQCSGLTVHISSVTWTCASWFLVPTSEIKTI